MNRHTLLDGFFKWLARPVTRKALCDRADSPRLDDHLAAVCLEVPDFEQQGEHDPSVETLAGEVSAGFRVLRWCSPEAATVVYHHGGAEISFDKTATRIFSDTPDINALVVRAPCHRSIAEFEEALRDLTRYMALFAVAIRLTEQLLTSSSLRRALRTVVAGFSQGGFITNPHHMRHDSANAYVPFMAGTAHADVMLSLGSFAQRTHMAGYRQPDRLRDTILRHLTGPVDG